MNLPFIKQTTFLFFSCLCSLLTSVNLIAQDTIALTDTCHLKIVFAGDIMGHDGQINGAYDEVTGKYNYEPTFRYISDYVSEADIAIGNLEVTLAGPPYKGYPQFSSPDELAFEAKKAGFDVMAMANNHALDGGEKGFLRTLTMIDSIEFLRLGTYRDSMERDSLHPLIINFKNFKIALLNYTYGTNGLTIKSPRIINRIDTAQINLDLLKARNLHPDLIIIFIHWGLEYERLENQNQVRLAKYIFQKGADVIIGSHPHVVQPYREYKLPHDTTKIFPVLYSLGNFVSNQRDQYRDGGVVAELHISKINGINTVDSVTYLPYWVWRKDNPNGRSTFHVLPVARYEQNPELFEMNESDIFKITRFAKETREHLKTMKESLFYSKK